MITGKRQGYSIASFFSSKEHDFQTEKGITDATENKLGPNLNEERQTEPRIQALQNESKIMGLRNTAPCLGKIENRTGAKNLSQAKIQIFSKEKKMDYGIYGVNKLSITFCNTLECMLHKHE